VNSIIHLTNGETVRVEDRHLFHQDGGVTIQEGVGRPRTFYPYTSIFKVERVS
jgi:hypothetical protein